MVHMGDNEIQTIQLGSIFTFHNIKRSVYGINVQKHIKLSAPLHLLAGDSRTEWCHFSTLKAAEEVLSYCFDHTSEKEKNIIS